jgi:plastocyanin
LSRFLSPAWSGGAFIALLASCGGGDEVPEAQEAAPPAVDERPRVDPAAAGSIQGTVRFVGDVPKSRAVAMGAEAVCNSAHDSPVYFDTLLVQDGGLANAFVWVKEGLESWGFDVPSEEVVLDQRGCLYAPRVVGVQVGQPLTFVNSDPTTHNVHTVPEVNRGVNFSMSKKDQRVSKTFKKAEVMVKTKCDLHPWMGAWVGVVRHSAFAVSAADGSFSLAGLPPGDFLVEVWHEDLGLQTGRATVEASGTAQLDFTFSAK